MHNKERSERREIERGKRRRREVRERDAAVRVYMRVVIK
jgi:hypothetical protein